MVISHSRVDLLNSSLTSGIVWQIAQRDYKFGKGKHRSLTKATYDAVGDHFRSLWGMEAGWAHSVLFTADLRAFSERLAIKVEAKDEETAGIFTENTTKIEKIPLPSIKREPESAKALLEIEQVQLTRRTKRRKKS